MLTTLSIKNYALIEELNVEFNNGFSIVTGETGAGKSILLGALGLVLGKRADTSFLKQRDKKCIVEAEFSINQYGLEFFFEDKGLDYDNQTIIRREILPSGKSRAFVNDTPTTLAVLNGLSERLIDVHSQHQTLSIADKSFQFKIIDALANTYKELDSYKRGLSIYKELNEELDQLTRLQMNEKEQYEYNLYLLNELASASLKIGEQEEIEKELVLLNNVELIKSNLVESIQIADSDEYGILNLLGLFKSKLNNTAGFSQEYEALTQRVESVEIEFKDVFQEVESKNEQVVYNPSEIERLNDRLQLIVDLLKKHSALEIEELLQVKDTLSEKVDLVENSSKDIADKRNKIAEVTYNLNKLADTINSKRTKAIPSLKNKLEAILSSLGMNNARFDFKIRKNEAFLANGKDDLELLFSANKGENFGELKKVASGGELSRIMLAVKSVLSNYIKLPTIIFDEIDTGVSGEISTKMGDVMSRMSSNMQVLSITHLPQIAAKGIQHYKVYKSEIEGKIKTQVKQLTEEERVNEIAEMLGGKDLSVSALAHAKELLG